MSETVASRGKLFRSSLQAMQRVVLVAKPGNSHTGVGRYVEMLHRGLASTGHEVTRVAPTLPPLPAKGYSELRKHGLDLGTFLTTYPVWADYPAADIYHLTSQNLASLLLFRRPKGKVVVTVHDIIPYVVRHHPELSSYRTVAEAIFDRLAMIGLRRADKLVADSYYTAWCLAKYLAIKPAQIRVVYLGIDHEHFRPQNVPESVRERYGLPPDRRYLIYVGSEDPRKNLTTLVRALAAVRQQVPNTELIKVGRAHFDQERQQLLRYADELGVRGAIHFLDDVSEEDLPLLYNLADICVQPSFFEGFGFPVLEAQACGTPVICANTSSLPELAGVRSVMVAPQDASAFADSISALLGNRERTQGIARRDHLCSDTFTWPQAVAETARVYESITRRRGAKKS